MTFLINTDGLISFFYSLPNPLSQRKERESIWFLKIFIVLLITKYILRNSFNQIIIFFALLVNVGWLLTVDCWLLTECHSEPVELFRSHISTVCHWKHLYSIDKQHFGNFLNSGLKSFICKYFTYPDLKVGVNESQWKRALAQNK